MLKKIIALFVLAGIASTCFAADNLYENFLNPPAQARPFVRWWWGNNQVEQKEIVRELDIIKAAGLGGIEINPIEKSHPSKKVDTKALVWLSKDWNDMLVFASTEAKKRGMITDMIAAPGWPFGGEFLTDDQINQRVLTNHFSVKGGQKLDMTFQQLCKKTFDDLGVQSFYRGKHVEPMFIKLIPKNITDVSQAIDLMPGFKRNDKLSIEVPEGDYYLSYGILQIGVRSVTHGVPGASGYALDHYNQDAVKLYMERLKTISKDAGVPLNKIIRALFCDSIELSGANWTHDMDKKFKEMFGYDITPYLPFVLAYESTTGGYRLNNLPESFKDDLRKVRYDFSVLMSHMLSSRFAQEVQDFCTENDILFRYQAYGYPWLVDMMTGYLIPDIPEGNNILTYKKMSQQKWNWSMWNGYLVWNLYASSAANLKGRKIVSSESMTNVSAVFMTSLDDIKVFDDMSFMTGINHSVLHGMNYSPPEVGFPGWIRYGTFFSEYNTWWPYFKKWADYNARLSAVFQESQAVKTIAILPPEGDIWADYGFAREPLQMKPWYCFKLWESLSQSGSSCDYVGEGIIQAMDKSNGRLSYGPMSFEALILADVKSLNPKTAEAIYKFLKNGGKVIAIDSIPSKSLSFSKKANDDKAVADAFASMKKEFPKTFIELKSPKEKTAEALLGWTMAMLDEAEIAPDVKITEPSPDIYQMHKTKDGKDIYFINNIDRVNAKKFDMQFPTKDKTPWIWNAETGERSVYPYAKNKNELSFVLQPSQSMLIVFEPSSDEGTKAPVMPMLENGKEISATAPWRAEFKHINGTVFSKDFSELKNLEKEDDEALRCFAGTIVYTTKFNATEKANWLKLGNVNKGITEVKLNGVNLGVSWYGQAVFNVSKALKDGENILEIKYTTLLSNYCKSLKDNSAAKYFSNGNPWMPMGIEGPIILYK